MRRQTTIMSSTSLPSTTVMMRVKPKQLFGWLRNNATFYEYFRFFFGVACLVAIQHDDMYTYSRQSTVDHDLEWQSNDWFVYLVWTQIWLPSYEVLWRPKIDIDDDGDDDDDAKCRWWPSSGSSWSWLVDDCHAHCYRFV